MWSNHVLKDRPVWITGTVTCLISDHFVFPLIYSISSVLTTKRNEDIARMEEGGVCYKL